MKRVHIRYFAAFRDAAGTAEETVDSEADTLADLFAERVSVHEGLRPESAAKVALNDTLTAWERPFDDGDEVLFFPPVAGG